jgi:hypothetical protein
MKKVVVISAVNFVEGGALSILRDCLDYISLSSIKDHYKIVVIILIIPFFY